MSQLLVIASSLTGRNSFKRRSWVVLFSGLILASWALTGKTVSGAQNTFSPSTLYRALLQIQETNAGKPLLRDACQLWNVSGLEELSKVLIASTVSRTDAVLTRKFDPETGVESRERQITVYLKVEQVFSDLILDLAHELVHATARGDWDPYDPELTAGKYVWNALEGPGGEVDAVTKECEVGRELADIFRSKANFISRVKERCEPYFTDFITPAVDRERVKQDFYRSGEWHAQVVSRMGEETELFPKLSAESPRFYSSTGQAPYPYALLKEFKEINQTACENTLKRVKTIGLNASSAHREGQNQGQAPKFSQKANLFLARRCQ